LTILPFYTYSFSNHSIEKVSAEMSAASSEEKDDSKCTSLTETEKNSDVSMKDQSFMSNESINISLAQSITNTPIAFRKHMKVLNKKIDILDTKSVNGRKTIKAARVPVVVSNEEADTETDTDSLSRMDKSKYRMQSVSNTTLTNVSRLNFLAFGLFIKYTSLISGLLLARTESRQLGRCKDHQPEGEQGEKEPRKATRWTRFRVFPSKC
jgi:hypothetical protein